MSNPAQIREEGVEFQPKWNTDGLVSVVTQDDETGDVLMLAHMNDLALAETLATGIAHYWSRSRAKLWKKGETSGELQQVTAIFTDCDQDALLLRVKVLGRGAACHTGRKSCFYRRVHHHSGEIGLEIIDSKKLFDPSDVYE